MDADWHYDVDIRPSAESPSAYRTTRETGQGGKDEEEVEEEVEDNERDVNRKTLA